MIQDQGAAGIVIIVLHQGHHPVRRSHHHSAGGPGHVHTIVGPARLAVVNPLTAIDTTDTARERPLKITEKGQQDRVRVPRRFDFRHLATNPLEHRFQWRLHGTLRHPFDTLDIVLTLAEDYRHLLCLALLFQRQHLLKVGIPAKTNGKESFRCGPYRPVTQFDRHPTCHLATQQRPLGSLAFQREQPVAGEAHR